MVNFVRKAFELCSALFILIFLTFIILRLLPGGPYDDEVFLHPLVRQKLEESWALHADLLTQFANYFQSVLRLELGYSLSYPGRTVASLIAQKFKYTFTLNILTLVFICSVSFFWSYLSFISGKIQTFLFRLSQVFLSLPALFIGPLLMYLFGFYFLIFPVAFLTSPIHYVLPIVTLSFRPVAFLYRLHLRGQNEIARADFLIFARAKGLTRGQIYFKHVLKNTLPVAMAYLPALIVSVLSGSFLVEMLYSIPGMGLLFIEGISSRDYPLILGITLMFGIIIICLSQVFNWLLFSFDPRLRTLATDGQLE